MAPGPLPHTTLSKLCNICGGGIPRKPTEADGSRRKLKLHQTSLTMGFKLTRGPATLASGPLGYLPNAIFPRGSLIGPKFPTKGHIAYIAISPFPDPSQRNFNFPFSRKSKFPKKLFPRLRPPPTHMCFKYPLIEQKQGRPRIIITPPKKTGLARAKRQKGRFCGA